MASTRGRWLQPSGPELVFGIVLVLGLVAGRDGFVRDPGTFWHLRLGREIARSGSVPRSDFLTYTRVGAPWVDQSWAFDLGLAALVDRWGWSGAVGATALLLAAIYAALARGLERDGASTGAAVLTAILAAGIGSLHFLVRPHLFTFAFVLWFLQACRTYHLKGGWSLASIPPLMVVWANLHGGFLAGPVIVAGGAIGHAVSEPRDAEWRRRLRGFAIVLGLSTVAPLVNPYGIGLYRHVFDLLFNSGVTELIGEYQPMPFGRSMARVVEWVVLALIALPIVARRLPSRYDLVQALIWLHFALGTVRHAPLFAFAVAPALATLIDGLRAPVADQGPRPARAPVWALAACLAVVGAIGLGARLGGPDPGYWPLAALPTLDRQPAADRLFHEQDWGGLIEEHGRTHRRSFIDDRFELWSTPEIRAYLNCLEGGPSWDALRDRHDFRLVWVRPNRALARRLLDDPTWSVLHRDKGSILFHRKDFSVAVMARVPGD